MFCVSGQKPPQIEFPFRAQVHTVFISIWVNQSEPKPSASAYPRRDSGGQRNKPWNFAAKLELHGRPCGRWFFFGRKSGNLTANRNDGWDWGTIANKAELFRFVNYANLPGYDVYYIYICTFKCVHGTVKPTSWNLPNTCCDHFPPFTSGNQTWQWTI